MAQSYISERQTTSQFCLSCSSNTKHVPVQNNKIAFAKKNTCRAEIEDEVVHIQAFKLDMHVGMHQHWVECLPILKPGSQMEHKGSNNIVHWRKHNKLQLSNTFSEFIIRYCFPGVLFSFKTRFESSSMMIKKSSVDMLGKSSELLQLELWKGNSEF